MNGGYQFYDLLPGTYDIELNYPLSFREVKTRVKIEEGSVMFMRFSAHASLTGIMVAPATTTSELLIVTEALALQEIPETKLSMQ